MSNELKPCPFCGNEPAPYWKGAGCVTSGCVLNGLHLDADKWNRRAQPAEADRVELGSDAWMALHLLDRVVVGVEEEPRLEQVEDIVRRMGAALSAVTAERDAAREELERAYVNYNQASYASTERRKERDQLRAEVEALRKDKARLDAIEQECWDVRYLSSPNGDAGDSSIIIEVVGHFMDKPCERVVGENHNENLRAAIDQAMTAEAYPPARPEYDERGRPVRAAMAAKEG